MQRQISENLLNLISEFVINELGSKVIDGITYTFISKEPYDVEYYEKYKFIRDTANQEGFGDKELIRIYEVCNGYIFDLDLYIAKVIISEMYKGVLMNDGTLKSPSDYKDTFIKDKPEQRRKRDMANIARKVKAEYDKGNTQMDIALFSKNTTHKIIVTGTDRKGKKMMSTYDSYVLRHEDLRLVNEEFLIPAGIKIDAIKPCEILPNKNGLLFTIHITKFEKKNMFR